jgi:hypothetical protein
MEKKRKKEKSGPENGHFGQKGSKTVQILRNTPRQTNEKSRYFIFEVPARSAFSWFANAHMSDERLP